MINTLTTSVPTEPSQQLLEGLHNQILQISGLTSGYLTAFDDFSILSLKFVSHEFDELPSHSEDMHLWFPDEAL